MKKIVIFVWSSALIFAAETAPSNNASQTTMQEAPDEMRRPLVRGEGSINLSQLRKPPTTASAAPLKEGVFDDIPFVEVKEPK